MASALYDRAPRALCKNSRHLARCFSVSSRVLAAPAATLSDAAVESGEVEDPSRPQSSGPVFKNSYKDWIEGDGIRWRAPQRGKTNWIGGSVPFPTNPTFRPPPPMSDAVRTAIYQKYSTDPAASNIRTLSAQYGVSLQRTEAILRLKTIEAYWTEDNKQLQTAFNQGMESYLGVKQESKSEKEAPEKDTRGMQLDEDAAAAAEVRAPRVQRIIWEMVGDGEQPIVATIIEEQEHKQHVEFRARLRQKELPTWVTPAKKAGRAPWTFVDVGGKYYEKTKQEQQKKRSPKYRRFR